MYGNKEIEYSMLKLNFILKMYYLALFTHLEGTEIHMSSEIIIMLYNITTFQFIDDIETEKKK